MGTNDNQKSSLIAVLLNRRKHRLALFTIAWLLVCFGGSLWLFLTIEHSLGEDVYWLYAGLSYFLVIVPFLLIDVVLFGIGHNTPPRRSTIRYILSVATMVATLLMYPTWGHLLLDIYKSVK